MNAIKARNPLNTLILFLAFFTLQGTALAFQAQQEKSFLWEVSSTTATAYILGSIHFANESFYPLDESIEKAFADSSQLVVEINPLTMDNQKLQQLVVNNGLYRGDETIADHIRPETLKRLNQHLDKNGIQPELAYKMKPSLTAITLSTAQLTRMGYSHEMGIDAYFCKKATGNKAIIELETMEEQLSLFFEMPDDELFLQYTLNDLDNMERLFSHIVNAWKSGDESAMNKVLFKPFTNTPQLEPILSRVYYDRNSRMVSKIKEMLTKQQKVFIVVGAGHLVGEKGIIKMLKNDNYTIRQL
ncbi:MAG: TraB/GumN family protein [Candidatus Thiodiazotropha sp.]